MKFVYKFRFILNFNNQVKRNLYISLDLFQTRSLHRAISNTPLHKAAFPNNIQIRAEGFHIEIFYMRSC